MGRLNKNIVYSINRIKARFSDDIGNQPIDIMGTGFWIGKEEDNGKFFVTNKHNLDPRLKLGHETKYSLFSLEIEVRKIDKKNDGSNNFNKETQFSPVKKLSESIIKSDAADCGVVVVETGLSLPKEFEPIYLPSSDLAYNEFLKEKAQQMDQVSFIGFPGKKTKWWDIEWNLPIARQAVISSVPAHPFKNAEVKSGDVILVSGLSFSGSSGSPVFIHEVGKVGALIGSDYVPAKIIGIMSGHWWDDEKTPEMFFHSGLSYLTSSRSILDLINKKNGVAITG